LLESRRLQLFRTFSGFPRRLGLERFALLRLIISLKFKLRWHAVARRDRFVILQTLKQRLRARLKLLFFSLNQDASGNALVRCCQEVIISRLDSRVIFFKQIVQRLTTTLRD
jgi:hypothetical protein